MKRLFAVSAVILSIAIVLNSCSGGGSSGTLFTPDLGGGTGVHSTTTTISGTVQLSSTVSSKLSSGTTYKVAATGSTMDKVLTAAGVKQAISMPPLVNAAMKLYNADQPDWIYPVSQVFTDSLGRYKFDVLMNADLNGGGTAYVNGDPIPAGNYTVIATNDTTVSGGKQYVAVQTIVKRFEGDMLGNDLVVQDSDALPSVVFMLGLKPNSDGTFGASTAKLASNAGIQIIFSMAMARLSVMNAVKLYDKTNDPTLTTPKVGTWKFTPDLLTATFYPTGGMTTGNEYTVKIAGGFTNTAAAVNVYGKQLPESVTAIFTADVADTTPPQNLMLLEPGSTNVPITTPIMVGSPDEPIDINSMTVVGTPSIGDKPAINYVGIKKVTIPIPVPHDVDYYIYQIGHTPLKLATNYSITISGVKDMAQNQISPLTFAFKTETTTNGVTTTPGGLQDSQLAVKDVFGKWVNAMNARNAAMLTTYMTGGFYWVTNGWSPFDQNRDGRLSLNEFRNMLADSFDTFEYCGTVVTGDVDITLPSPPYPNQISITGNTADIYFSLTFTPTVTDPVCVITTSGTMKAQLEYINSAWLITRGADDYMLSGYPSLLDVIELSAPPKGITLPEPTPSNPLNPDFVWTAVSGISTYAVIITDAKSSDTGWVGLIDGSTKNQGDQVTLTYTSETGCVEPDDYDATIGGTCSKFVMTSGNLLGFTKNISGLIADGKYYWSIIGFKSATIDGTNGLTVSGSPADDLGASSQSFNFAVANDKGPYVIGMEPLDTTEGVPVILDAVKAIFSEAMDQATIDIATFYLTYADTDNTPVTGLNPSISYDAVTKTATLNLGGTLPGYSTEYKVHVTTGVRDNANPDGDTTTHDGNRMDQEKTWTFKTEIAPDTTPPTTTATPAGGLYNSAQNVTLTANESVQFIKYTTDGSNPVTNGTVYTDAIAITANTTLKFYASDLANPANDEPVKTENYIIDSIKPVTTASPAGGFFKTTPVDVTLSVDKVATIYYTTNGSDPTTSSSVYSAPISFTADGTSTLKFYAVDSAGNTDKIHSETYTIDTVRPDTTITSTPQEMTTSNFANFTFMSNEANATFECAVDTGGFAPCTNPHTENAVEGQHNFYVRAVDAAGNEDLTPATFAWIRDNTTPAGSIRIDFSGTPDAAYATGTSVLLTLSATDASTLYSEMMVSFSNDAVLWTDPESTYGSTIRVWTLSSGDGLKNVSVRFYDKLGNKSQYSDSIILDTTEPETNFTQTPSLISGTQVNIFEFGANEAAQRFECSMDGVAFTTCTTPYTSAALSDGSNHTFRVRAVDMAGLTDQTPASYTWKVDTTALVTVASPGGGQYNISQSPVNVTLTPTGIASACQSPAPVTYYCVGSGCTPTTTYAPGAISFNVTGTYTLRFYSVEQTSGTCTAPENESNIPPNGTGIKEQVYNLDLTAPTANITGSPANPTNNNSAAFTFETAIFECDLDGAGYTACASPMNYVNLSDATHTFNVRAIDTAHNTGNSATYTWKIDTTPPTSGSVVINSNATYTNSTAVTLTMSASDTSSTVTSVLVSNDASAWSSYPYIGSPMSLNWNMPTGEGAKYVYVKFVDTVGNISSMYSDGIILDTIVPDTYIYGAPANPTTARGSYFYFYASETTTFQCSNNNGASWYACSNPTWVYYSYDGTYNFQVKATDSSGLIDSSPASYSWQIFTGYWDSGQWDYSNWGN